MKFDDAIIKMVNVIGLASSGRCLEAAQLFITQCSLCHTYRTELDGCSKCPLFKEWAMECYNMPQYSKILKELMKGTNEPIRILKEEVIPELERII